MISETKGDTAVVNSKVTAIQQTSSATEKQLPLLLRSIADVDSKVAAIQHPLRAIEQQLPMVLSRIQDSRILLRVPTRDTRDCCQTNHLHLQDLQDDYNGFAKCLEVKYRALQDHEDHATNVLTDLTGKVSSLSLQIGNTSSAIRERQEAETAKSDAAVASLRGLHTLMSDLKYHDIASQQVTQYAQIQDRINDIQEAVEDFVRVPAELPQNPDCRLLKSRNGMTRMLIGAVDNVGVMAENRFEWSYGFCWMATYLYQFGSIGSGFASMLRPTAVISPTWLRLRPQANNAKVVFSGHST